MSMLFGGLTKTTLIDYPGKVAAIVYTIGCNFRCPYCHNPELVDETVEKTYTEETVLSFLRSRVGLLDGVVITGGEPTMHEDLIPFMKKVKALGFLVKLDSNGTNPAFIKKVIDRKLADYIAMDLKAPLERYHEVAGRPVDTGAIRKSIKLLKTSGISYEFRTTVIKALVSSDDIERIAKTIAGADAYYLQKFIPSRILNPQFKRKVTYTDEEFSALLEKVRPYVKTCAIR